jgi:hypothetical protein
VDAAAAAAADEVAGNFHPSRESPAVVERDAGRAREKGILLRKFIHHSYPCVVVSAIPNPKSSLVVSAFDTRRRRVFLIESFGLRQIV